MNYTRNRISWQALLAVAAYAIFNQSINQSIRGPLEEAGVLSFASIRCSDDSYISDSHLMRQNSTLSSLQSRQSARDQYIYIRKKEIEQVNEAPGFMKYARSVIT